MFTSLPPQGERTAPSPRRYRGLAALGGALGAALALTTALPALAQTKGPSSSATPYVLPLVPEFKTTSIFTVGDSVNAKSDGVTPQRMVGVPDGLGAFDDGGNTFTVLMNHEIGAGVGAVRDHGARGAFIARYTINKETLQVLKVSDLVQQVALYNVATGSYNAPVKGVAFSRLCSADLPPAGTFAGGEGGFNGRIFMNGEETGAEGRAFGHVVDGPNAGTSYELPYLGKFSWENSVTNPSTGAKTVVIGTDDGTGGQVYLYLGAKHGTGNPVERAGLSNGVLYGIKVAGMRAESRDSTPVSGAAFTLAPLGDVSAKSGAQLETESGAAGVTSFLRPEDGSWDPTNSNRFYFATTDRFDTVKTGQGTQIGRSRLWRLNFKDASDPTQGGTIDLILDGTGDYQMLDNITVDKSGLVLAQEDPGNQAYTARIQEVSGGAARAIAQHDPARFGSLTQPPTAPFTSDEESSGIIDISDILGRRAYLFDVQAHYNVGDPELVEGGQLLILEPNDNQAPTLDDGILSASVGQPFTYPIVGHDNNGDTLTYTLTGGALPAGVVLASDGTLSGTPTQTGLSIFTVTVNDGRGGTATGSFNFTVNNKTDGVAPILTRDDIETRLTRDQLAALTLSGTVRDVASEEVTPSGVKRVQVQLRRNSDGFAYNGKEFARSQSPYYTATLSAPAPNTTAGTRDYSRSLSFVPQEDILKPGGYSLVLVTLDNAGNYSGQKISITIVASPSSASSKSASAQSAAVAPSAARAANPQRLRATPANFVFDLSGLAVSSTAGRSSPPFPFHYHEHHQHSHLGARSGAHAFRGDSELDFL